MSYAFRASPLIRKQIGDKEYMVVTITESEVAPTSEWKVDGLPEFFTITLFESAMLEPAGGTVLNPRLGTAPAWEDDSIDDVIENTVPGVHVRLSCSVRVASLQNQLHGRTAAGLSQGTIPSVVTRITMVEGH